MTTSIGARLDCWAERTPTAPAILDIDGQTLSFAELHAARQSLAVQLRDVDIAPGDHVAVLMANGPELAITMLGIVSFATCLPLDPSLTAANMAELTQRGRAVAIVCDADNVAMAAEVARRTCVPVLRVSPTDMFGHLAVSGEQPARSDGRPPSLTVPTGDHIAVLIATSGTTGRPKIIPLRHRHVLASAAALASAQQLQPTDRALAIVPFWFGQGFVSTLVASLAVGGSVVCARAMMPEQFDHWLGVVQPTWYTAPPSMHAHLVAVTGDSRSTYTLRFIRAAGSVLSEDVRHALEARFGAPVIDVYGLTEALGLAATPFAPQPRPAGSVGLPTSTTEVRVVDAGGRAVDRGVTGEIIVRGPMVADGYFDDEVETAARFRDGWLHTGDVGMQDDAGFVFVAGRAGDLINHAGQKVSPSEVEAVLLTHPAVADVAVCAVAHTVHGHDVAAGVVVRSGHQVTPRELRQFASGELAPWKLPSTIVFVDALPRTSSGKVLRSQLAEVVGRSQSTARTSPVSEPPITPVEQVVAEIFARHLKKTVSRHDDFFSCGGDSLRAMQVVEDIRDALGQALKVSTVYRWPTVAELSEEVERWRARAVGMPVKSVAPARTTFVKLFYPSNLDGIADELGHDIDIVDIVVPEQVILDGSRHTVESLAAGCIADLDAVRPSGPLVLAGHSFAALIAFEAAVQLRATRRDVLALVIVDGSAPGVSYGRAQRVFGRMRFHVTQMAGMSALSAVRHGVTKLGVALREWGGEFVLRVSRVLQRPVPGAITNIITYSRTLSNAYEPRAFDGPVLVIRATHSHPGTRDDQITDLGWAPHVTGKLRVVGVEGDHESILVGSRARIIADHIKELLRTST